MKTPLATRLASRIAYWLFALFLVAVAGVTGLWFVGAELVREQIAEIGRNVAGDGGTFSVATLNVTGFPFTFSADLSGIIVSGRDSRGAWEWRAEKAVMHLSPWLTRDATFDLAGNHKVRFRAGRVPLNLDIDTAEAPGSIRAGDGDEPDILTIRPKRIAVREVTTNASLSANAANLQVFLYGRRTLNTEPAAGVLLELSGVALPDEMGKYLGPKLTRLGAEVQVLSALPAPLNRQNLARWRETGGSVEVKNLSMEWGPLTVDGSGTMTLDGQLQPEASFAARMTGFEEAADALVAAGLIGKREAESVKLLLSLMAKRSNPGAPAEIRTPITIQDRAIFVGPARLARMPTIRW